MEYFKKSTKHQTQFSSTTLTITTEYARALARTNTMFCAGFFVPQNFFHFFRFLEANHTFHSLYGSERGRNTFQVIAGKGVRLYETI